MSACMVSVPHIAAVVFCLAISTDCIKLRDAQLPSNPWLKDGSKCSPPMKPSPISHEKAVALRNQIIDATKEWHYIGGCNSHAMFLKKATGKHILDVGMGQGPWGVVALSNKAWKKYTGMDPALCVNQHALTRNNRIGHTLSEAECNATRSSEACLGKKASECKMYEACSLARKEKYKPFPFTGVQMMQAFEGDLLLIPGTFETAKDTGLIQPGAYDVATLHTVTEHLQDVHSVIQGIYNVLSPGSRFVFNHHNYYAYDGHHKNPQNPEQYTSDMKRFSDCGNWNHLDSTCASYDAVSLNRIRLGDLLALINIYFEDCHGEYFTEHGVVQALTKTKRWEELKKRNFIQAELIISHYEATCRTRVSPRPAPWLNTSILYKPPTDGSYLPQELPETLQTARETHRGHGCR